MDDSEKKNQMKKEFLFGTRERDYFTNLNKNSTTGKIETRMEQFWLCALVGLVYNRKANPGNGPQMVDEFVEKLSKYENLLRAFVFFRYGEENVYKMGSSEIMNLMSRFFDETTNAKLSKRGYYEFSRFAAGGFEKVQENIGASYDKASFLIKYAKLLKG